MPLRSSCLVALAAVFSLTSCAANEAETKPAVAAQARTKPTTNAASAEARGPAARAAVPRAAPPKEALEFADFNAETFARAKKERKYIVLHGAAEWCHWCHVMEATTYHDPDVQAVLRDKFIAVKVDTDERPDIQERYQDWGYPATVVFSPDGVELAKQRGYIDPGRFRDLLNAIVAAGDKPVDPKANERPVLPKTALPEEELGRIFASVNKDLASFYDPDEGGWGRDQKAPLGYNNAFLLKHAFLGDNDAKARVLFTLDKQSQILDPVWGGIFQYSAASNWNEPHFEKLMTFQAPALENYAEAYRLTGEAKELARARGIYTYLERFMKSPEGGFYTTQDADVNAHDPSKPFVDGHEYYVLGDKERLAKGLPRIDTHEYAKENGIAIAAYLTYARASGDTHARDAAIRAAKRIWDTHAAPNGALYHPAIATDGKPSSKVLFLADNASFGYGLMRLYEETGTSAYLRSAQKIGDFLIRDLQDPNSGGFFASTKDPDAAGVLAVRRVPFEENVMALRFLAKLATHTRDDSYRIAIDRTLRAISTTDEIKARGRWLGDYLLALEETKEVRGVAK
jgi:uncharacterized protein YyaL (SSP411 family)